MKMNGIFSLFRPSATSKPIRSGSSTSTSTRSGRSLRAASRAVRPPGRRLDVIAGFLESGRQKREEFRVVVDDEDARARHARSLRWGAHGGKEVDRVNPQC